ncbi:MAG: hypothetical protein A2677_00650 [Candidatus Komeilibacteria bacterium RIFCSPHIGHO2_01_FULL_52_14]|uniref:Uncharacterized protein n=1 Tax=Candidatus Komeilibacteria bacterium RIFCSPHIGHO2_01_FULL_52_14 TaxID=1798549 RepID=A0A1G2BJT8_9BACT|nr:MAG: hypothetical protein A2677_00650 [Candidatus Komeilibacteria bacterium RIFCSPHIGHO2_01_FULL_52_14]
MALIGYSSSAKINPPSRQAARDLGGFVTRGVGAADNNIYETPSILSLLRIPGDVISFHKFAASACAPTRFAVGVPTSASRSVGIGYLPASGLSRRLWPARLNCFRQVGRGRRGASAPQQSPLKAKLFQRR